MVNADGGEEKFFGLVADDPHPDFDACRRWICCSDIGVAWRASTDYDDKAAGQGPESGTFFDTTAGACPTAASLSRLPRDLVKTRN